MSVLSGTISLAAAMIEVLADTAYRMSTLPMRFNPGKVTTYADGSTANQVESVFYHEFTATAAPQDYDLSAIVCNDGTVGMPYVREVLVFHDGGTDGEVLTYGGGTNPFIPDLAGAGPTEKIQAGTAKRLVSKPLGATGHAVGANVGIRLDPGAATISGKILILGHQA
jgi:hypothetical protein